MVVVIAGKWIKVLVYVKLIRSRQRAVRLLVGLDTALGVGIFECGSSKNSKLKHMISLRSSSIRFLNIS